MDPLVHSDRASRWNELHDDVFVISSGDVDRPGRLCGLWGSR